MDNKKIRAKTFNLYSKEQLEDLCIHYNTDKSTLFRTLINYIYEYPNEFIDFSNQKKESMEYGNGFSYKSFALSLLANNVLRVGVVFYQDGLSMCAEKGIKAFVEGESLIIENNDKSNKFKASIDLSTIKEISIFNMKNRNHYNYFEKDHYDKYEYVEIKCEVI